MAKRVLAVFLCLCLMVPCIGLQLVLPASAATDSAYVIADLGLSIFGVKEVSLGVDFTSPALRAYDEPLDLSGYANVGLQLDLYTEGDDGLVSLLESQTGGIGGQIELSSGGIYDTEELSVDTALLNFKRNTWVRQIIPLSSFANSSGDGTEIDLSAVNYARIYMNNPDASLLGQKALMRICKVRLVNLDVAAPSTVVDPIGDCTFIPHDPVWTPVTFGAEYADYSDLTVAGYNMKEYAETYADEHGLDLDDPEFDWAPVFNSLVDALQAAGGGTLFIPAGHYAFYSEIHIPRGVQVYGEWASPEVDHTVKGTVFDVYCGRGGGMPFITMDSHSQVQNLSIWYPEQDAQNIVRYSPTFVTGQYTDIKNVTLVNAYFGIQQSAAANAPNVSNVYGTPLSQGLDFDMVIDISRLEEIHFSPDYWIHSGLANAPYGTVASAALREYLYANAVGVTLRRIDWSYLTYSSFHGYKAGVRLTKAASEANYPNGQLLGLEFTGCLTAILVDNVQITTISMADITIKDCEYGLYLDRAINIDGTDASYTVRGSLRGINLDISATAYAIWQNNGVHLSVLSSVIRQGLVVSSSGHLLIGETTFHTAAPQVILQPGATSATLLGNTTAAGSTITVDDKANISETNSSTALDLKGYTQLTAAEAAPKKKGPAKEAYYIADVDNTGATDVTEALQTLLTQAGNNGGGLVYVPPGKYLVNGTLNVPTGVELRGATDYPSMPAPVNTIFLVTRQGDTASAATVNLQPSAGIRAITFHYPEQSTANGDGTYNFVSYPYMIRSLGSNVYVINISSHNAWNGVDLATYRSDDHYVDAISGHFFNRGIVVGNGSTNGVIRNYQLNYNAIVNSNDSPWGLWGIAPSTAEEKDNYFHYAVQKQIAQSVILQIGDVTDQLVYDSFNYGCKYGVQVTTDAVIGCGTGTAGPNGLRLFGHAVDWSREAIRIEAGQNIELLNIQVTAFDQVKTDSSVERGEGAIGNSEIYALRLTSDFTGEITIHNFAEWGPDAAAAVRVDGGTLNIYNGAFNNNDGNENGYFFDINNSKMVNLVGFTTTRSNTPRVTDSGDTDYVKITGGYYASQLKYPSFSLGSLVYESNFPTDNLSYVQSWTNSQPTDFTSYFTYEDNGNGVTVTGYTGSSASLTIPAMLGGKPVTAIAANAFSDDTGVTTVCLPTTVTSVGTNAFAACTSITSVIYAGSTAQWNAIAIASGNDPLTGKVTVSGCEHGTTTTENYKAATDTVAGYTGDTVCSVCSAVVTLGRYIPATGYAYFDTMGGTLTTSHTVSVDGGNTDVVAIGDTGEYGIKLTGDWQGFNLNGKLLQNVPEGRSVTMVIEYYINSDVTGQMFRYQAYPGMPGDLLGDGTDSHWNDIFSSEDALVAHKSGLVFYTFTAAELAALRDTSFAFTIKGCTAGTNVVYIQSARLVDTAFVNSGVDRGYDYGYFTESVLCDYYPDITGLCQYNVAYTDADFRYIDVYGDAYAASATACQPVYIKFYAADGYQNSALTVNAYEALVNGTRGFSIDLKGSETHITMANGVGELYMEDACFRNGLNDAGSFRLSFAECEKITHFEVYDVATYCAEAEAEAKTVKRMHELMLESNYNLTTSGYVEPSVGVVGSTGATVCATCGEELVAAEPIMPECYAYLETAGGTLTTSHTVAVDGGNTDVVAIGDTGEYGIKLTGDWQGFNLNGKLLQNVPEGQSVTMAIEYYINSDTTGQMFRYQAYPGMPGDLLGDGTDSHWNDIFSSEDALVAHKSGLVFYTFTAAELAALRDTSFAFTIKGCTAGTNVVYIQSMRLVNTEYVHTGVDTGCTFVDFEEKVLCDYYPDILATSSCNMRTSVQEVADDFNGYCYFWVTGGNTLIADTKANKPLMLKFYAADGYETGASFNAKIDVSDGNGGYVWYDVPTISFAHGVDTVILEAGLANRLNDVGSLRIPVDDIAKVSRVEIYDITTYCAGTFADDDMKDTFHAWMLENDYNLTKTEAVEPTPAAPGNTGSVLCATCGEVLVAGEVLGVTPYAWIETDGGQLTYSEGLSIDAHGDNGSIDVVAIGDTGEYGIQLKEDWSGFWFGDEFLQNVPEGQSVTLAIEYYIAGHANDQIFRYKTSDAATAVDLHLNNPLVEGRSALVFHTLTAEDIAQATNGDTNAWWRFFIMGCPGGANNTYIQSVRLVNTDTVHAGIDFGYSYIDYEEKVLCDFYPDIVATSSHEMITFTEGTLYQHFAVSGNAYQTDSTANKPVYIKVYTKKGYENTTITFNQFEVYTATGRWACDNGYDHPVINVVNGEGAVMLPETSFTNGNNGGSFRLPIEEIAKLARIEVYDVTTYCAEDLATDEMIAMMHTYMQDNAYNLAEKAGQSPTCIETGYTASTLCATCNEFFAGNEVIPVAGHSYTDANDNICDVCGTDATLGYYTYTVTNGAVTITDVNTAISGDVVVPDTFEGYPVTAIDAKAFADCASIVKLTLPATVQSVGADAFVGATGLTAVYITDLSAWCSVDFGSYTANPLYYARTLYVNDALVTDLVIPSDVTEIAFGVFYGCDNIVTVTIPNGVKTIGRGAFYGCASLEEVTIADSVNTIGFGAFYECSMLGNVTIGSGVKTVDNYAFYGCLSLEELALPNGVTTIGDYAFRNAALYTIALPDSVTTIGTGAFYDCPILSAVTLPNGTTAVADKLFYNCVALKSIVIPDSVQSIGTNAFYGCTSLGDVTLGDGLETISSNAFRGCTALTEVTIPAGVTAIGNNAFRGCTALETVHYNAAYATMGVASYPVFADCTALTTVYVGDSVTAVPAQAFRGATNLTTVYLTKNTKTIEKNAFYLCDNLTDVYYIGTASDFLAVDVKSFNTALTDAAWNYNTPCVGDHTWSADCDALCDLCGETRSTTHDDIVTDAAVEPTCEATGLTAGSHCAACGNVIVKQAVLAALGHTWNEGTVLDAPSAEANGSKEYTCTVCGDTKIVELTLAEIIDGYYYYDGEKVPDAGLVYVEGNYYCVSTDAKVKTGRYAVSNVNGLPVAKGIYYFFEDGTMNLERGVYDGYYYNETGVTEAYVGLIEWNGAKYYVNDYGKVITGRYFVTKLNGLVPEKRAYTFLEDGRMLEDTRIHTDGFYYEDGIRIPYAGLVEYEGAFYYVTDNGAYVKDCRQIVSNVNNTGKTKNGRYYFDADGKMLFDVVIDGYYYGADGCAPSYAGLVEVDGSYYYVSGIHGALVVNAKYAITQTNGLMDAGTYTFDATGKLVG